MLQSGHMATRLGSRYLGSQWVRISSTINERLPLSLLGSGPNAPKFHLQWDCPESLPFIIRRCYADTPASRPKAHTGRKAAKTPAKKSSKKSDSSKTVAKKSAQTKPKSSRKSKPKAKKKATVKRKAPQLSQEQIEKKLAQKEKAQVKKLRQEALLRPPKKLPSTAWTVFNAEHQHKLKGTKQAGNLGENVKASAAAFKSITPEEVEHYNHVANANKDNNLKAYRAWITSFTPKEVYIANRARRNLQRQLGKKNTQKYPPLKDERLVRRPITPYAAFNRDRFASGDLKGLKLAEASKLISREWKALSDAAKADYKTSHTQEQERYQQETKTVYGH